MNPELLNHEIQSVDFTTLLRIQLDRIRGHIGSAKTRLTVVHVGGFDGSWDSMMADICGPLEVFSFEPQLRPYRAMKKLFRKDPTFMHCYNCIVSPFAPIKEAFLLYTKTPNPSKAYEQGASLFKDFVRDLSEKEHQGGVLQVSAMDLNQFVYESCIPTIDLLRINCEGGEYIILDDRLADLFYLQHTNMVALALHGKRSVFLTSEMNDRKRRMTEMMRRKGFRLIYGYDFMNNPKIPIGHVWQLWVRETFLKGATK